MHDEYNSIPLEKYQSMLADIRDMFPVPAWGSDLEISWAGAMASPEYVPTYVGECLQQIKINGIKAVEDSAGKIEAPLRQPYPNEAWCVDCNPDNCSGCGFPTNENAPDGAEKQGRNV